MEGHSTRVCELCGTLYPPNVEQCPADGEPTVAAMIVRSAPSGRHAPQAPTRLASNFRPSLSQTPAAPERFAAQLPREDFFNEPQLPPEEETSIRISIPQQPRAVYSESQPFMKAPVLTALREMRSFSEAEMKQTQHRRPSQQGLDDEPETAAMPRRDDRERPSGRQPQRAPTPAPQQSQRRPRLTQPEFEPAKAPQKAPRPMLREPEETRVAITADKRPVARTEAETSIAIPAEPPKKLAPIRPLEPTKEEPVRAERVQAPSLSLQAVPLAYAEPEAKPSLFSRFLERFVPWLTELKESSILRLIALVLFLIIVAKVLLFFVQMFGE